MSNNYDYDLDLESQNSLSVIISKIHPRSCVLEFGPAHGRMTRYLKEVLECTVYGVEIDPEAAATSRGFMEHLIVEDIGTLGWLDKFRDIAFDVIIFADVLEHLHDPLGILTHAATLLKEDGTVYVSVPNITHNSIVMELFKERFTYSNAGLLDSTHIRFFSYGSFRELVEKSSLSVDYEDAIIVPPELSEFSHLYEDFSPFVGDFLENREYGEVYQFIFGLKRLRVDKPMARLRTGKSSKRYGQLLVDCGEGFGEHIETIFIENQGTTVCLEFAIERYTPIVGLRFDPLNRCAIVTLHEAMVLYNNGESAALGHSVSNAKFSHDGRDYFTTYDPIYHLDFVDKEILGGKTVKIVMSYREDSCGNILEEIINSKQEIINSKQEIINSKQEIINRLNRLWLVRLSLKLSRILNFILKRNSHQ